MHNTVFKIQDNETGKYWNGNYAWPSFSHNGHKWNRRSTLERDLTWYMTHAKQKNPDAQLPSSWRVVEMQVVESIKKVNNLDEFMFPILVKAELNKLGWRYQSFYKVMETRNAIDAIEFILKLKPNTNERFVSTEKILESRAQLRLLGVKTRTFREFGGMFGMMNREQAMRAKMVLDIESCIDLGGLRETVRKSIHSGVFGDISEPLASEATEDF